MTKQEYIEWLEKEMNSLERQMELCPTTRGAFEYLNNKYAMYMRCLEKARELDD